MSTFTNATTSTGRSSRRTSDQSSSANSASHNATLGTSASFSRSSRETSTSSIPWDEAASTGRSRWPRSCRNASVNASSTRSVIASSDDNSSRESFRGHRSSRSRDDVRLLSPSHMPRCSGDSIHPVSPTNSVASPQRLGGSGGNKSFQELGDGQYAAGDLIGKGSGVNDDKKFFQELRGGRYAASGPRKAGCRRSR